MKPPATQTGQADQQDWQTEIYKGVEVHASALPHAGRPGKWDYTVRVSESGADSSAESELVAESGDDADYASKAAAVEAGFVKGYKLVDELQA